MACFGRIVVAQIENGKQVAIARNYFSRYKDKVGSVLSFPNPNYVDPATGKLVFILPWYMFVEIREPINYNFWEEKERYLYYFLRNTKGDVAEVDVDSFMEFVRRCDEYALLRSAESEEELRQKPVRIQSGLFANYEGVVEFVKKNKVGVKLNTTVSITIWVDRKDLTLL